MLTLRLDSARADASLGGWDGLGILHSAQYLPPPKLFYCPSHTGDNRYGTFAQSWHNPVSEIVSNYHFRGAGPTGGGELGEAGPITFNLYLINPAQSSLLADGMRIKSDYNHKVGVNFFRADLTVHWYSDPAGRLADNMADTKESAVARSVNSTWLLFDASANANANTNR